MGGVSYVSTSRHICACSDPNISRFPFHTSHKASPFWQPKQKSINWFYLKVSFLCDVQERRTDQSLAACAARSQHPWRVEATTRSSGEQNQKKVLMGQFQSARCGQRERSHSQAAGVERGISVQTWIPKNCKTIVLIMRSLVEQIWGFVVNTRAVCNNNLS